MKSQINSTKMNSMKWLCLITILISALNVQHTNCEKESAEVIVETLIITWQSIEQFRHFH